MTFNKILVLFIAIMSISFSSNAGLMSKGIKAGATYTFVRFAVPAITKGAGKKAAGWALKKLKSKSFTHFTESMTVLTFIAVSNTDYKENVKDIMDYAGVLTPQLNNEIDEESEKFQEVSEFFTEKANSIDRQYKKRNCDTYLLLLSKEGFRSDQRFINNPIQEWNVGSYKELEKYAVTGDNLEHDHIPSYQSLISFLNSKGLKVKKNNRQVKNNGTAFEIKKSLHMNGATYGGKQNKQIDGVIKALFDSKNLRGATIRDLSYHFINSGYDKNVIKAFTPIYKRNLELCLYN